MFGGITGSGNGTNGLSTKRGVDPRYLVLVVDIKWDAQLESPRLLFLWIVICGGCQEYSLWWWKPKGGLFFLRFERRYPDL
jgi:hypothetical protein